MVGFVSTSGQNLPDASFGLAGQLASHRGTSLGLDSIFTLGRQTQLRGPDPVGHSWNLACSVPVSEARGNRSPTTHGLKCELLRQQHFRDLWKYWRDR